MLVPLSWLKDYVDIDVTPQELEEKLRTRMPARLQQVRKWAEEQKEQVHYGSN